MSKSAAGAMVVCALASILVLVWFRSAPPRTAYFVMAQSERLPSNAPLQVANVHPTPRLTRGITGSWDGVDLLNPSVIRFRGRLFNYYSGFDGKVWRTGVALSDDGVSWKKYEGNPVLFPSHKDWDVSYITANGAAVLWGGKILYFYQGVDSHGVTNIGLATSDDGFNFQKAPRPVLTPGPRHTWDSVAVADPYIFAKGDTLYLYFLGQDERLTQRLGVARSKDGKQWEKLISNPILDVGASGTFDENGLGEPSVAHVPPYFYLIYTGRDASESRNIGYALSSDGVNWKKVSTRGLLSSGQRGTWAAHVVCDTTLLSVGNGKFLVWFGGGDKHQAAENLNGDVGLLTLDLGQNRDLSEFDANDEWERIPVKSTDILVGSYGIEGKPNGRATWVGPNAHISLLPDARHEGKALVVQGWVPAGMIADITKKSDPVIISLVVRAQTLARTEVTSDKSFSIGIPWSDLRRVISIGEVLDLELRTSTSFVPAQFGKGNDLRDLAFMVSSIRFE